MPPSQNIFRTTQTFRFRTTLNQPATATPPGQLDLDLANATESLLRNLETLRRQLESQTQARRQQQQQQQQQQNQSILATGRSPGLSNNSPFQSLPSHLRPFAPSPPPGNNLHPPAGGGFQSMPNFSMSSNTRGPASTGNSDPIFGAQTALQSLEMETRRLRLFALQQQVSAFEGQIARGIPPPIDSIISVRNQLYSIIDDQYRNVNAPRDGQAEALLSRTLNVYVRADQLRVLQARRAVAVQADGANPATGNGPQYPLYLLASPSGYQAVLVSPAGLAVLQPSPTVTVPQQTSSMPAGVRQDPAPVIPPNPVQPAMENVVRQAVLNQAAENNQQDVVARNARRVWLFIRLYFFCYLFSESGTWSRFIFVTLAILISLLSETGFPQRLHRAIVDPVQRHLEGLVHAGGEEPVRPTGNNGNEADLRANRPGLNGNLAPPAANREAQRPIIPAEMQQGLRRVERAVALFIASLVPGVGERHVEVRNAAAEAARNAERAREEERRRNEERVGESGGANNEQAQASEGSSAQNRNSTTAIPRDDAAGRD